METILWTKSTLMEVCNCKSQKNDEQPFFFSFKVTKIFYKKSQSTKDSEVPSSFLKSAFFDQE